MKAKLNPEEDYSKTVMYGLNKLVQDIDNAADKMISLPKTQQQLVEPHMIVLAGRLDILTDMVANIVEDDNRLIGTVRKFLNNEDSIEELRGAFNKIDKGEFDV